MNSSPAPGFTVRSEPLTNNARYDEQQNEVRSYGAEPDVKGTKWRKEGHERVDHVHPLRQDLGRDVHDEEGQRTEGDSTVHGLGHDPVPGGKDHPVGRDQAGSDRRGQPDKREYARVVEHEVLSRGIDTMTLAGH